MKLHIRAMLLVALFAAVSLVPPLHALTGKEVSINVPFAFNCGAQHFAPGTYTLQFLNMKFMLLRRGQSGRALVVFALHNNPNPAKSGYAVFTKIGARYFLDEVWMSGSAVHVSINERKWEKSAALEVALDGAKPSRVEAALLAAP